MDTTLHLMMSDVDAVILNVICTLDREHIAIFVSDLHSEAMLVQFQFNPKHIVARGDIHRGIPIVPGIGLVVYNHALKKVMSPDEFEHRIRQVLEKAFYQNKWAR